MSEKQTAYGWIIEEDLPQSFVDRQNWSGMISLPRTVSLIAIKKLTGALRSNLEQVTSLKVEA